MVGIVQISSQWERFVDDNDHGENVKESSWNKMKIKYEDGEKRSAKMMISNLIQNKMKDSDKTWRYRKEKSSSSSW